MQTVNIRRFDGIKLESQFTFAFKEASPSSLSIYKEHKRCKNIYLAVSIQELSFFSFLCFAGSFYSSILLRFNRILPLRRQILYTPVPRKMNVLVYNGPGTTPGSVKHATETLRDFLEPYYAVSTVTAKALELEPWTSKTSAIVFPGGADLPYIKECKAIIPVIKKFVAIHGGIYIGFCAGGYFGTQRVEFAQGDPKMEVTGNRDMEFFPGIGRGPVFSGFQYNSEAGARAAKLILNDGSEVYNYYNGGGLFVDADQMNGVEVLAHYDETPHIAPSDISSSDTIKPAAVVICKVGKGTALLTGTHPEFIPRLLDKSEDSEHVLKPIINILKKNDLQRKQFMKLMLTKIGLTCNKEISTNSRVPNLTPILVSAPLKREKLLELENNIIAKSEPAVDNGTFYTLNDETDTFHFYKNIQDNYHVANSELQNREPEEAVKTIIFPGDNEVVSPISMTPNFSVEKYFANLNPINSLGSILLYGEVVTSTSSLLNNNKGILSCLPDNSTLHIGTVQVSGRGRGGNVWVNPKGVSAATAVVNLPLVSPITQKNISIVFVQYISMLAYCKAITSYAQGFEDLPVRIKWPNDLYALSPNYYRSKQMKILGTGFNHNLIPLTDIEPAYVKISGLLVNTHFINNKYTLLLGCGINVNIDGPTTSLKTWVDILNVERRDANLPDLPYIEPEILQALYLNNLEPLLDKFIKRGASSILPEYYKYWLHTNQIVTLSALKNTRTRITGITEDYGLLIAAELEPNNDNEYTGTTYNLQPDGNTFDIFKGLIAKKVT